MGLRLRNIKGWYEAVQLLHMQSVFDRQKEECAAELAAAGFAEGFCAEESIFYALEKLEPELRTVTPRDITGIDQLRKMFRAGVLPKSRTDVGKSVWRKYDAYRGWEVEEEEAAPAAIPAGEGGLGFTRADAVWALHNVRSSAKASDAPSAAAWNLRVQAEEDNQTFRDLVKLAMPKEEAKEDTAAEDRRAFDACEMKQSLAAGLEEVIRRAAALAAEGKDADAIIAELLPLFG